MSGRDDIQIIPEDAGTTMIEIPESPSEREIKKDLPLLDPVPTTCSRLPPSETVADEQEGVKDSDEQADSESILLCNEKDMSPPGTTRAEDSQHEVTDDPGRAEIVQDDPEGVEPLLVELMDNIISRLSMLQVLQLRPYLGSAYRNAIHRPAFRRNRPSSEGEYSPTVFMTDAKGDLHWHGFDTKRRKWTRLPSLNFPPKIFPSPHPDPFKDYLMAGDGGLLCVNVGKAATGREKLVICNPLTRTAKVLPRLIHARRPVLMHLKVDHDSGHYEVIVAGSAACGMDQDLSLKTEVYDSKTDVWKCPDGSDLPGPPFCLNEYQNGAYIKDGERELLMCVAFVDKSERGVLVYDVTKKRWTEQRVHIPLVRSEVDPNIVFNLATAEIMECGGSVFVFSKQECGRDVHFVIHELIPEVSGVFKWDEVMNRKSIPGILVYPEFTCVPISEHTLCLVNIEDRQMEIIDLKKPMDVTPVVEVPSPEGHSLCILNPPGFPFRTGFTSRPCPGRCDPEREEYCSKCQRTCSESDMNVGLKVINDQAIIAPAEETDKISDDDLLEKALKRDNELFEKIFYFLDEVGPVV